MSALREDQIYDEALGPPDPRRAPRYLRPASQWDDPTWLCVEVDTDYMHAKGVALTAADRAHNRQLAAELSHRRAGTQEAMACG
jgi:predicted RNA-binding protein with PUA-like domain